MRVLVHMEEADTTILCSVMGMVGSNDIAANRAFRQQSSLATDERRAVVGNTDSRCLAKLRFLVSGILGMERRGERICLSLRDSLSYSRASLRNGVFAHSGLAGRADSQIWARLAFSKRARKNNARVIPSASEGPHNRGLITQPTSTIHQHR